jgi:hypothetical protein
MSSLCLHASHAMLRPFQWHAGIAPVSQQADLHLVGNIPRQICLSLLTLAGSYDRWSVFMHRLLWHRCDTCMSLERLKHCSVKGMYYRFHTLRKFCTCSLDPENILCCNFWLENTHSKNSFVIPQKFPIYRSCIKSSISILKIQLNQSNLGSPVIQPISAKNIYKSSPF